MDYINKIKLSENSKSTFVCLKQYTSTDWHDMSSVYLQLQENGVYEIKDADTFVATDIYERIKDMVSKDVTPDVIKEIMNGNDDVHIDTVAETTEKDDAIYVVPDRIEVFAKARSGIGYQSHFDAFDYTHLVTYDVSEIEKQNVVYLVSEHIVNPGKGCDILERMYHEPFASLDEAQAYVDEMNKDYDYSGRVHKASGYKITVVDKEAILNNTWYKDNMLAIDYMQRLGLEAKDYRFWVAYDVVSTLQEKVYEKSTDTEKLAIDKDIYGRIRDYLSDKHAHEMDSCLQACKSGSRAIVDKALVLAHVDATSQEEYDAIHKSLGEYKCRVELLTRANVEEMRGHGKVCITKDGEIGYFENAYGINAWEGAKGNPYYGTLFSNMGSTVDILKDFRYHDKFVDVLPDQTVIDDYYERYMEWETSQQKEFADFTVEKTEKVSLSEKIKDASERPGQKDKALANAHKDLEL